MLEKQYFNTGRETQLCGILCGPEPSPDTAAVILCHGFASSKDGRTNLALEKRLNSIGIATLRFDFFGHGDSGGDFAHITISQAVDDVCHALRFVFSRGYGRLGLVGSSFGGMAAVLAASHTPELVCLALKSPISDYLARLIADRNGQDFAAWKKSGAITFRDEFGRIFSLDYGFYTDAQKVRGYDAAPGILFPTLIIHGEADETVPVEQSQKLASLLHQGQLYVIPGADHRYSRPGDFEIMVRLIFGFLRYNLKGTDFGPKSD